LKTCRFGIIGCSRIAKSHMDAIMDAPDMELVAVCDINESRAKEYAGNGLKTYKDHREMLKYEELDIVTVATPNGLHARHAMDVIAAGRHLVVEKPLALSMKDVDNIIKAADHAGVKLAVVHQVRFNPLLRYIKELLDSGRLGKLSHASVAIRWNRDDAYFAEASWRGTKKMDGGMLLNQAIHQLDAFFLLMGPVSEIFAMTATRLRKIETEDVGGALVRFKNGTLGVIESTINVYPRNLDEGISIFAEKGTIQISGKMANQIKHWECEFPLDQNQLPSQEPFFKGHQRVFADFIEAIKEDRESYVSGKAVYDVLKYIFAMHSSARYKKPVIFREDEGGKSPVAIPAIYR